MTYRGLKTAGLRMAALLMSGSALFHGPLIPMARAQAPIASFDIPAQPLGEAVNDFGRQAHVQITADTVLLAGRRSTAVSGRLAPAEALSRLLTGTGIVWRWIDRNTVALDAAPQSTAGAIALGPVRVEGEEGTSATAGQPVSAYPTDPAAGRLVPPTTIASKTPATQREIPQTVDVISQPQIQQQQLVTLADALRYTPGITVFQYDADRVQFYARGFPIASMQVDGVPMVMNSDMSANASTNSPNLALYDRVEVLDGPSGLYNGFGSPGGVINLVRKRAPARFQASADLSAGTSDNFIGTLDVGGPLNASGSLRARVVAHGQTQDLPMDSTWKRDQSYYGTIEADVTPDTTLRLGASHSWRLSNVGWSNITPVYAGSGLPIAGRSTNFTVPWSRNRYLSTDAFGSIEHRFDNGWKVSLTGDYTSNKGAIYSGEFFSTVDPADNSGKFGTTNKRVGEHNASVDLNAAGHYTLLGMPGEAVLGFNLTHMRSRVGFIYGGAVADGFDTLFHWQTVDALHIVYPEQTYPNLPRTNAIDVSNVNNYGFYGSTKIRPVAALSVILGARVTWWTYRDTPDPVYNAFDSTLIAGSYKGRFTPYAGLVYDLSDHLSLYASYASIFEPQTSLQRNGSFVPPIEGKQYEAGVKASTLDGRLNASLAFYWLDEKNRAASDPTDPTFSYYVSVGRARTRGIDARLAGNLTDNWTINAGYTFNDSKYLDQDSFDYSTSDFTQIAPKHLFKLWSDYRLPGRWKQVDLGMGLTMTSTLYYQDDVTHIEQPTYATADARIGYKFSDRLSLSANVTNLFNGAYYAPILHGVVYSPGRQVLFTLRASY